MNMKKSLFAVLLCMTAIMIVSCGKKKENTPQGVVEYNVYCLDNQDFEGFLDCYDWRNVDADKNSKLEKLQKAKDDGKLKDFHYELKVLEVEYQEFTNQHIVKTEITFTKLNETREEVFYVKDVDGEYKIAYGTGLWIIWN